MTPRDTLLYSGRILRLMREAHTLPNGRVSLFEIVHHPGGAAVLPFLPDGRVVLIRQFRPAAGGLVLEAPAGRLEPGEEPANCARRELEEEAGYRAGRIVSLGSTLSSIGYSNERIHLFAAFELSPVPAAPEPDEWLEPLILPWSEALAMAADGRIDDAKTQLALLLARNLPELA